TFSLPVALPISEGGASSSASGGRPTEALPKTLDFGCFGPSATETAAGSNAEPTSRLSTWLPLGVALSRTTSSVVQPQTWNGTRGPLRVVRSTNAIIGQRMT